MTAPVGRSRQAYIDYARGIAVLVMIEAHAIDAWTRAADRHSVAFRNATILGGFAAPLFLWLAGLGVAIAAARAAQRSGSRRQAVEAVCRRGLEIFLLAFLFRVQAFVVSPGSHPVTLFRVDILNIMGPAMAGAGLLWACARTPARRAAIFAAAAAAVALITPIVRVSAVVDTLPVWLQWYVRPSGEHTTFTLLPWAGFVAAGAAVGVLIAAVEKDAERRMQAVIFLAGAAVIAIGFYTATLPTIYRSSSFWTSSPTWFAIRVGVLMVLLPLLYAASVIGDRLGIAIAWLSRLGRSSLFVYWIHVELVYGYATWLIHGRLPLPATIVAYLAFSAVMYGAVVIRDELAARWRGRRDARHAPQIATA